MSFLKRVGSAILKGLALAQGFAPFIEVPVEAAAPQTIPIFDTINGAIQTVEAIGQALGTPGPQKLTMATALITAALLKYTNGLGHKVKDTALFQKAVAEYTQASVDLQNSLE